MTVGPPQCQRVHCCLFPLCKGQRQAACLRLLKGAPNLAEGASPVYTACRHHREPRKNTQNPTRPGIHSVTQPPAKRESDVFVSVASTRLGPPGVGPQGPPHSHPYPEQTALGRTRVIHSTTIRRGQGRAGRTPGWFQRKTGWNGSPGTSPRPCCLKGWGHTKRAPPSEKAAAAAGKHRDGSPRDGTQASSTLGPLSQGL